MTAHLTDADYRRMARAGMAALTAAQGLDLFDLALTTDHEWLLPMRLDPVALRAQGDALPALLRGLVRVAPRRAAADGAVDGGAALVERLAGLGEPEQDLALLELVLAHVATVLGHADPAALDPGHAFTELGFDSLTAVELRNRLNRATGRRLAATLVFDHPTPVALAGHLRRELIGTAPTPDEVVSAEIDRLGRALAPLVADPGVRDRAADRLHALLARWAEPTGGEADEVDIESSSVEQLLDFVDREFGINFS
ncbi:hypothetical protein EKG83_24430 [Saccharothrix syringae]|uniref:Carrier domain-containing protein n=2 Tax=Saccharothrix syringae TaxID=103733 RepID=A0A5Q0HFT3_SACSY|nr:hypothetical protein EKG83_24430 [Saccharothrix syringae]